MTNNVWTIIPTGGEGTRLKPYTNEVSKPLVPLINNFPILELILYSLAYSADLRNFIFGVKGTKHYTNLQNYFQGGSGWSSKLQLEPQAHFEYQNPNYLDNGTADSALYNIKEYNLTTPVIVVQADNLFWGQEISDLYNFALKSKFPFAVGLTHMTEPNNFGVADFDSATKKITKFVEKPLANYAGGALVNTGIYIIKPEVFTYLEYDFGNNVLPKLVAKGLVGGHIFTHRWYDFGNPQEHLASAIDLLRKPSPCFENFLTRVCTIYETSKSRVWVRGRSSFSLARAEEIIARISAGTIKIEGDVFIGKDSVIENGVYLKDCALGDLAFVGERTQIIESNILDAWQIGKNCKITASFFGRGGTVADNVTIAGGFYGHNERIDQVVTLS